LQLLQGYLQRVVNGINKSKMVKTLNTFQINIAGIIIRIDSQIDFSRFADISFYNGFISRVKAPHCKLFLKNELSPALELGSPIFNPAGNWQLFKMRDGKIALNAGRVFGRNRFDELIVCNSDYSRGVIYKKEISELFRRFFDQFIIINILSAKKGFLLHSSGVIWQEKGLCFSGRSGVGKTTLIRLFEKETDRRDLLSDDRLAIRRIGGKWHVFGTPWHGDAPVASSKGAVLKALFFIRHSSRNSLRKLSSFECCRQLMTHGFVPYWDEEAVQRVLDSFNLIAKEVPAFEMGFLPDKRILRVIDKEAFKDS